MTTAIYRPVEGGYTLVILDEEQVPIPLDYQDPDVVHPSLRAAKKAAQRIVRRYRHVLELRDAEWEAEEL